MPCSSASVCPTLCDPVDYSPPGSSVHGIFQVRILEWLPCPPPENLFHSELESMSPASLYHRRGGSPYTYTCTHRHLSLLKIFLFQELTDISYQRSSLFQTCPMLPILSTTHLSLFYFSFKGAASTWIVTVQKYEFSVARTPNFSEKLRFQIYRWNHSFLK